MLIIAGSNSLIGIFLGDPLTEKEAEELIKEADLNNDGKVDYIEFVAMTCKPR